MLIDKLRDQELEEIENIETDKESEDRFKVEDVEAANWCFRKLKAIQSKEQEIKQLADAERQRINDWESKELEQHKVSREHFEFLLEEYFRENKAKDNDFKVSTPYGTISSRVQQPKFNRDNKVLLDWVKENKPEFVKIAESADWAGLKKEIIVKDDLVATEDGEIVEGITVEHRDYSVNIKVVD